jgi:hypothetical protein
MLELEEEEELGDEDNEDVKDTDEELVVDVVEVFALSATKPPTAMMIITTITTTTAAILLNARGILDFRDDTKPADRILLF